jgi:hypothetical protein
MGFKKKKLYRTFAFYGITYEISITVYFPGILEIKFI